MKSTNLLRTLLVAGVVVVSGYLAPQALAAEAAGNSFAPYTFEVSAGLGIDLPYDIWGTPGTLRTFSLRGAYKFNEKASFQMGEMYQHAGPDKAYTTELGFGFDLLTADLNTTFLVGYHFSMYKLQVDYADDGVTCVPANCLTDSGSHRGVMVGAGLMIPMTPYVPLRLMMKFYQDPQVWLLLEASVGVRF